MTHCQDCQVAHDLDQGPDEGVCQACGGQLVDHPDERPQGLQEAILEAVTCGLAGAAVARGKSSCGTN